MLDYPGFQEGGDLPFSGWFLCNGEQSILSFLEILRSGYFKVLEFWGVRAVAT